MNIYKNKYAKYSESLQGYDWSYFDTIISGVSTAAGAYGDISVSVENNAGWNDDFQSSFYTCTSTLASELDALSDELSVNLGAFKTLSTKLLSVLNAMEEQESRYNYYDGLYDEADVALTKENSRTEDHNAHVISYYTERMEYYEKRKKAYLSAFESNQSLADNYIKEIKAITFGVVCNSTTYNTLGSVVVVDEENTDEEVVEATGTGVTSDTSRGGLLSSAMDTAQGTEGSAYGFVGVYEEDDYVGKRNLDGTTVYVPMSLVFDSGVFSSSWENNESVIFDSIDAVRKKLSSDIEIINGHILDVETAYQNGLITEEEYNTVMGYLNEQLSLRQTTLAGMDDFREGDWYIPMPNVTGWSIQDLQNYSNANDSLYVLCAQGALGFQDDLGGMASMKSIDSIVAIATADELHLDIYGLNASNPNSTAFMDAVNSGDCSSFCEDFVVQQYTNAGVSNPYVDTLVDTLALDAIDVDLRNQAVNLLSLDVNSLTDAELEYLADSSHLTEFIPGSDGGVGGYPATLRMQVANYFYDCAESRGIF